MLIDPSIGAALLFQRTAVYADLNCDSNDPITALENFFPQHHVCERNLLSAWILREFDKPEVLPGVL
jgi:hypothetical protein